MLREAVRPKPRPPLDLRRHSSYRNIARANLLRGFGWNPRRSAKSRWSESETGSGLDTPRLERWPGCRFRRALLKATDSDEVRFPDRELRPGFLVFRWLAW